MIVNTTYVGIMDAAIVRDASLLAAVREVSLRNAAAHGRTDLAWRWALTGQCSSPVTLSAAAGVPPDRARILAEMVAEAEGGSDDVQTQRADQDACGVLRWLIGLTDVLPTGDYEPAGYLVGARDRFVRSDAEIRAVLDSAIAGTDRYGFGAVFHPDDMLHPWSNSGAWFDAAWLSGVRDLLAWVLGDRLDGPLAGTSVCMPTASQVSRELGHLEEAQLQGREVRPDPSLYPPPQAAEAMEDTRDWLTGEITTAPCCPHGLGAYQPCYAPDCNHVFGKSYEEQDAFRAARPDYFMNARLS